MQLNDQDIVSIFNTIKDQGHPDPVGFLARSELLTGLDHSFSKDSRFGVTGVKQDDVDRIEAGNAEDVVSNLAAAVKVDLDNFSNFKDVSNMHVAFQSGGEAVADRSKRPKKFLRDLSKAKIRMDKRLKKIAKGQEAPEQPSINVEEPEIVSNDVPAQNLVSTGDASKLDQIRGALKSSPVRNASIPKKRTSKAKTNLRNLIRKAVRNA